MSVSYRTMDGTDFGTFEEAQAHQAELDRQLTTDGGGFMFSAIRDAINNSAERIWDEIKFLKKQEPRYFSEESEELVRESTAEIANLLLGLSLRRLSDSVERNSN